jgi:hypothetical protein
MRSRSIHKKSQYKLFQMKPSDFPLGSIESRAAARARKESLVHSTYHCAECFLTGFQVMESDQPGFVPTRGMEKQGDIWIWRCPKHIDPSKEATVQALIKSGLLEDPRRGDLLDQQT